VLIPVVELVESEAERIARLNRESAERIAGLDREDNKWLLVTAKDARNTIKTVLATYGLDSLSRLYTMLMPNKK
jgi:hypothetical protein